MWITNVKLIAKISFLLSKNVVVIIPTISNKSFSSEVFWRQRPVFGLSERISGLTLQPHSLLRYIDRYIYLYNAYKSKESLGASVAKEMCFQRSSEGIEVKSRTPQSGWKIVPQSRTGWCRRHAAMLEKEYVHVKRFVLHTTSSSIIQ